MHGDLCLQECSWGFLILHEKIDICSISVMFFMCTSSVCIPPFKRALLGALPFPFSHILWVREEEPHSCFLWTVSQLNWKRKLPMASSWGEKPMDRIDLQLYFYWWSTNGSPWASQAISYQRVTFYDSPAKSINSLNKFLRKTEILK